MIQLLYTSCVVFGHGRVASMTVRNSGEFVAILLLLSKEFSLVEKESGGTIAIAVGRGARYKLFPAWKLQ